MQKALDISESETFYSHMAEILKELGHNQESEFYLEKGKLLKESLTKYTVIIVALG